MLAFVPAAAGVLARSRAQPHGSTAATAAGLPQSRFCGAPLRRRPACPPTAPALATAVRPVSMLVDPWSVSPQALDVLAAQFFAASLAPYLVFLYFLERPQSATPPLTAFGFRFLLVFVFATIPAGIYAKVHYGDILANVDWLHGGAESLLTITNLLIALGLRGAMQPPPPCPPPAAAPPSPPAKLNSPALATAAAAALSLTTLGLAAAAHVEPANALSLPTWVIHVSSLIEWLVAMGLVWQYAGVTGNPRWKGLTWGMLPLHTSGICACTFHLFYNAPALNLLVTIQAALTCFGNATMAAAAYRIARYDGEPVAASQARSEQPAGADDGNGDSVLVGFEDLAAGLNSDSGVVFVGKLLALSTVASIAVKWGELYVDGVFEPTPVAALSLILIPTALNVAKWGVRSRAPDSDVGKFL